jgi:hypothetical protein
MAAAALDLKHLDRMRLHAHAGEVAPGETTPGGSRLLKDMPPSAHAASIAEADETEGIDESRPLLADMDKQT